MYLPEKYVSAEALEFRSTSWIGSKGFGLLKDPACGTEASSNNEVTCLSIGIPKSNKFSICSKCKINYFLVSQNLGKVQPNYNVLKYWDT